MSSRHRSFSAGNFFLLSLNELILHFSARHKTNDNMNNEQQICAYEASGQQLLRNAV